MPTMHCCDFGLGLRLQGQLHHCTKIGQKGNQERVLPGLLAVVQNLL